MKTILIILLSFSTLLFSCKEQKEPEQSDESWPVLTTYDQQHLYQIALPLGGIGTGTVSLGGRGELCDWEIMNRPAKGFYPGENEMDAPFFSIYTKVEDNESVTKALMGPLYDWEYQHMEGRSVALHGLPRFESASFKAAYPFGQVDLRDRNMPVDVKIKGFNPLSPAEPYTSGLPLAVLYYEVKNKTDKHVVVSVSGNIRNFIGVDGSKRYKNWKGELIPYGAKANRNVFINMGYLKGIYMYSDSVDQQDPAWGSIAISVLGEKNISHRTGSALNEWNNSIKDYWDDFSKDGMLEEKVFPHSNQPMASLAATDTLSPGETREFKFLLTWYFPNRTDWWGKEIVGNYYTTNFQNAWNVAEEITPYLGSLEKQTSLFVKTLLNTNLPKEVLEAALYNLSTLRSQTVFRTPDEYMFGWEGVMNDVGSCWGSCTHVWNYEQATPFLFGSLAKSMREVEFGYATDTSGLMSFRIGLPLKNARTFNKAAADGQMGTIMRFYREWQLSGDSVFLEKYWPVVKSALSFCWQPMGWDSDTDGVMEGIQHNTMDVEYYGPNPQMEFWYLGALRAAEEMARAMRDTDFEKKTHELFLKGSAWTDANLFNGEYYEQIIKVPEQTQAGPSVYKAGMGSSIKSDPDYQLGRGCLIDQLVGQYMAHLCNLGYLAKKENIKKTYESILKYNYVDEINGQFNNMRSYALGNESGLRMAGWPKGMPEKPFPYFAEVMTGFEYTAAAGMIFEGMDEAGLKTIRNIRSRFDGLKRNPFNEAECGFHYSRAMSSWASIIALTDFYYSKPTYTMQLKVEEGASFWSNGYAWGNVVVEGRGKMRNATINVFGGTLELKKFVLSGFGSRVIGEIKPVIIKEGQSKGFSIFQGAK